jgi:hypothetical protein
MYDNGHKPKRSIRLAGFASCICKRSQKESFFDHSMRDGLKLSKDELLPQSSAASPV